MKKITVELYEPGDHVLVLAGYNKGKVGTVLSHKGSTYPVVYRLAGVEYRNDDDDDDDWDDEEYEGDYESSMSKFIKFVTVKEYEQIMKDLKILLVPGLPVSIQFRNKNFLIGDNVITPSNAKKIAAFINELTKGK